MGIRPRWRVVLAGVASSPRRRRYVPAPDTILKSSTHVYQGDSQLLAITKRPDNRITYPTQRLWLCSRVVDIGSGDRDRSSRRHGRCRGFLRRTRKNRNVPSPTCKPLSGRRGISSHRDYCARSGTTRAAIDDRQSRSSERRGACGVRLGCGFLRCGSSVAVSSLDDTPVTPFGGCGSL